MDRIWIFISYIALAQLVFACERLQYLETFRLWKFPFFRSAYAIFALLAMISVWVLPAVMVYDYGWGFAIFTLGCGMLANRLFPIYPAHNVGAQVISPILYAIAFILIASKLSWFGLIGGHYSPPTKDWAAQGSETAAGGLYIHSDIERLGNGRIKVWARRLNNRATAKQPKKEEYYLEIDCVSQNVRQLYRKTVLGNQRVIVDKQPSVSMNWYDTDIAVIPFRACRYLRAE